MSISSLKCYSAWGRLCNFVLRRVSAAASFTLLSTDCFWTVFSLLSFLQCQTYVSHGQDLVEQLLLGLGWRVTGQHSGEGTTSLLLATNDPLGVKFVVTAPAAADSSIVPAAKRIKTNEKETSIAHFALANLTRFAEAHRGNGQGVATLGFALPPGGIEKVHANYLAKHPTLLVGGTSSPDAAIATYEEGGVQTKVCAFLLTFSVSLRLRPFLNV